ncbi:MAG TPA: TerB family tellurite resistance protein [Candidatus Marinimicrobia bacterium]|nr:TerB family tellurite resistance protein [Candidatus Neomarinimicrobiota bacterium]
MANWSQHHDLVYAFVCVSFLADGEVDESEKEAMRGNVKVMLPDVSDDAYNAMEAEVIDKFIDLGDEAARTNQYGASLEALKGMFSSDEDRFKVVKNLAYIARADDFIHDNEMAMVVQAVSTLDMTDKVNLVKTDSTLFVDLIA